MISVSHLNKSFGGIHAVNDASLKIETGSITGLIGPNGAGKTTLFNIIAGLYKPDSGTVTLDGNDITGLPHQEKASIHTGRICLVERRQTAYRASRRVMDSARSIVLFQIRSASKG